MRSSISAVVALGACALSVIPTYAGQVPGSATEPDVLVSHRDRVYAAEQFSNTVSVVDPVAAAGCHSPR